MVCTTPMKLTSIMRRNSAASDLPNGADSALPALAIRISIGWRAGGFGNRGADGSLIRDVGYACEMRGAGGDGFIQRRAIAAEHGHRRPCARQRESGFAADASSAPCDERMRGMRQSGHQRSPRMSSRRAFRIYFKLQAFARNPAAASLTARTPQVASAGLIGSCRIGRSDLVLRIGRRLTGDPACPILHP